MPAQRKAWDDTAAMVIDLEARRAARLPLWSVFSYDDEDQHQSKLFWYAETLKAQPNVGALLDLGCGNGALLQHYPASSDYLGVDVAPGLIAQAQSTHLQRDFRCVDVLSSPLPRFDTVVMIGILGLSPRPMGLIGRACHLTRSHLLFDFLERRSGHVNAGLSLRYLSYETVIGKLTESGLYVAHTYRFGANVRLVARRVGLDGAK